MPDLSLSFNKVLMRSRGSGAAARSLLCFNQSRLCNASAAALSDGAAFTRRSCTGNFGCVGRP